MIPRAIAESFCINVSYEDEDKIESPRSNLQSRLRLQLNFVALHLESSVYTLISKLPMPRFYSTHLLLSSKLVIVHRKEIVVTRV